MKSMREGKVRPQESGFSLVELSIAILMLAVVSAGAVKLMNYTLKGTSTLNAKSNAKIDGKLVAEDIKLSIWRRSRNEPIMIGPGRIQFASSSTGAIKAHRYAVECLALTDPMTPPALRKIAPAQLKAAFDKVSNLYFGDCPTPCALGSRPVIRHQTSLGGLVTFPGNYSAGIVAGTLCTRQVDTEYISVQVWFARIAEMGGKSSVATTGGAEQMIWEVQSLVFPANPSITNTYQFTAGN